MADFWDDYGAIVAIVLMIFGVVGGLAWAFGNEEEKKNAVCARMMAIAATPADSITVIARCELGGDGSNTVVAPMPVIVGGRR